MTVQLARFAGDASGTVAAEYATAASLISVVIVAMANRLQISDFLIQSMLRASCL